MTYGLYTKIDSKPTISQAIAIITSNKTVLQKNDSTWIGSCMLSMVLCSKSHRSRDYCGYGLGQWEMLSSNASHWLSPYPKWFLHSYYRWVLSSATWNVCSEMNIYRQERWDNFAAVIKGHFWVYWNEMSSFWWNFRHWLHRKLSFWQLLVQSVMKFSLKWQISASVSIPIHLAKGCFSYQTLNVDSCGDIEPPDNYKNTQNVY